ncbi:MAG: CHAT domain-containing protein [Candidatus Eisenbacteria bacterium]|nr:CHAT domain-containing protein [Candidatus Eisenbacteria bacterium]
MDPRRTALQIARETLGSGAIVHLAAHTNVDLKRPWQSRLLLGDPGQSGAYLPVSSISRLRLQAQLCVLASCRSLGTTGLDNLSLAGIAPCVAGRLDVPTVVATQWNVDDRATAEFMRRFYVALARRSGRRGAAAGAARDARDPRVVGAAVLGGFVVLGDPGTRSRSRGVEP